jgi:hypothetical protein
MSERPAFAKLAAQCAQLSASEGILFDTDTPDGSLIQFTPLEDNEFNQVKGKMLNSLVSGQFFEHASYP